MRDTELYRQLLGLEKPWMIAAVSLNAEKQEVTVRVELPPGTRLACPECERPACAIKDSRERRWRHLDTCQFKTFIEGPLPRTDCPVCGVKTVAPPWAEQHGRFTALFERFAIDALREMSTSAACGLLRISWDEADGIMSRAVERGLARGDLSEIRRIGIDEKSAGKGQQYITVVYDLETSDVLWAGRDRTKATLDEFFSNVPAKTRQQIECITMDMWEPYRASCREWIPDADSKTTLDRFHIQRHLNQAVDEVRRREHRALLEQGKEGLKHTRWDWLYNRENLPADREARFEPLRGSDLKTARGYAIKENFRHFWNYRYPANARRFFKQWYYWATHSRLDPIITVARRVKKHFERIITYFKTRASNSVAEGINNKIETIKRKAYGFRNIDRYIDAIYFHCGGLELYPL